MRILHSSDWHLGQHFMGRSRQAEHRALIDWLLEQVQVLEVDLLLIAGDLFDTGTPPSYARGLFNRLVLGLEQQGCRLLVLGGNHDSVATLSEGVELFRSLGSEIRPQAEEPGSSLYLAHNRQGEAEAVVIACPYLRPRDILQSQAGESAEEKRANLLQAIRHYFADAYESARTLAEAHQPALPILLSAHLTAVGGALTESVRELYIGTLDAFPAEAFPPADYIALGHLHRPQQLRGARPIIYSGSPIPLSFDEANRPKSMQLLQLGPDQSLSQQLIEIPCFQPLATVSGNLSAIAEQLPEVVAAANLTDSQQLWLQISVVEDDYLSDLFPRVEALCADWPVEVLRLQRHRSQRQQGIATAQERESLAELKPEEVFARRLALEELGDERKTMLNQAFAEIISTLHEQDKPSDLNAEEFAAK